MPQPYIALNAYAVATSADSTIVSSWCQQREAIAARGRDDELISGIARSFGAEADTFDRDRSREWKNFDQGIFLDTSKALVE